MDVPINTKVCHDTHNFIQYHNLLYKLFAIIFVVYEMFQSSFIEFSDRFIHKVKETEIKMKEKLEDMFV